MRRFAAWGNRVVRQVVIVLGLGVLAAAPLSAQNAPTREGFWIGFGFGYGSLGVTDFGSREGGVSGYLKLGGTVKPNLLVGAESSGWYKSEDGVTLNTGLLAGTVTLYPAPASGFFVKGGVGLAATKLDVSGFGSGTDTGWGFIGGVGYDARVGRNMSITPVANWVYGGFDGYNTNVLQVGLGVTWH